MTTFSKNDVHNLAFDRPIADGKTKKIWSTIHPDVIAFEQKPDLVMANGTSVMTADPKNAGLLVEYMNLQNHYMFSYLNALGLATTYQGFADGFLFHKKCNPLKIEFVCTLAACDNASLLKQYPERYALWDENTLSYNVEKADRKLFEQDGSIIPFKEPILRSFHKNSLVIDENGQPDLLPESKAKENPRYWKDGKMTDFMNEDPILITGKDPTLWQVHSQKKKVVEGKPLALIDRKNGELYNKDAEFVRRLDRTEYLSKGDELKLQEQTLKIVRALDFACRNTLFKKTDFDSDGKIMFLNEAKHEAIIDMKLEYGITAAGFMLTDDLLTSNARFAWGNLPTMSFKKMFKGIDVPPMFQNANDLPELLLVAAMFAEGAKNFANVVPLYRQNTKGA